MKKIIFLSGLLMVCANQAFACPVGQYDVVGWNPGVATSSKPSYRGTASISAVGKTCEIQWRIGTDEYAGVGLYNPDLKQFAVSYANLKEGWFGLADYRIEKDALNGRWAVYGDKQGKLGVEKLTKK